MDPLRILIVDDHPLFRYGVRVFLDATPEVEVVGEATSGEEALALAERVQPDEVGGSLAVEPAPGGGTRLRARLPLIDERAAPAENRVYLPVITMTREG